MSGKRGKNDAADVAAICEALQRPNSRFVPVTSLHKQGKLVVLSARKGDHPGRALGATHSTAAKLLKNGYLRQSQYFQNDISLLLISIPHGKLR